MGARLIGLCVCLMWCAGVRAQAEGVPDVLHQPAKLSVSDSAASVLAACRTMLPTKPVELKGALVVRSRRGIVAQEYDYTLVMRREKDISLLTIRLTSRDGAEPLASVTISRRPGRPADIRLTRGKETQPEKISALTACVLETDVTWLDLTFDFLWWPRAVYETQREGESVHGQVCQVIRVEPSEPIEGLSGVRVWVDRKTGCLMQAEQIGPDGASIRRLWGTRVKKFDNRWMASVLEVEKLGTRRRTKITVEQVRELE